MQRITTAPDQGSRETGLCESQEAVTIVMACFNGEAHLEAQLASIASQSHRNWRLIASDDGSEDATLRILADFARRYPVEIRRGPGRGAAANFLSLLTDPDLPPGPVALADQDDVWLKGKLARGLRRMAAASAGAASAGAAPQTAVLYASESILADHMLRPRKRSCPGRTRPGFAPSLAQNLFAGHSMMLNSAALALLRRAGHPAALRWHDWWIYQLMAGAGARLVLDPLPGVLYRQHDSNLFGGQNGSALALRRRLALLAGGEWHRASQLQARALAANQSLLTPEARAILSAYLNAPAAGIARVRHLRALGLRRSSRSGDLLLAGAALFGRI